MKNIDEVKTELFEFIDSLEITYELYDILIDLYRNYDDRLFVKIMEEVKNENISFYDFKRIFSNNSFLEESLENQEKLYREHKLMRERLNALDSELAIARGDADYSAAKINNFSYLANVNNFNMLMSTYEHYSYDELTDLTAETYAELFAADSNKYFVKDANGKYVHATAEFDSEKTYYVQSVDYSAAGIEKENTLFHNLTIPTDDPMTELYRTRMLKELITTDDVHRNAYIDSMLLSVHDYIVPVDYKKILLNGGDLKFAEDNNIDLEEMKKIKSFAAFMSTYYQE